MAENVCYAATPSANIFFATVSDLSCGPEVPRFSGSFSEELSTTVPPFLPNSSLFDPFSPNLLTALI
jgi:hypothetical protein